MMRPLPDVHAPLAVTFWRACAACAAWLAHPHAGPGDDPVYCGRCEALRVTGWAGFDPRPYPAPDASVRRHSTAGEWVVLARDKDTLTLRRLGFPDAAPVTVHLSEARPRTDFRHCP